MRFTSTISATDSYTCFSPNVFYFIKIGMKPANITKVIVKDNYVVGVMTVSLHGGSFIPDRWNNTFGGVGHLSLYPRCPSPFLSLSHPLFSAATRVSSNYWGPIGIGFSIFDATVVEITRCRCQLSPTPTLGALLVWLNMPGTFTSLRQQLAMQCDCVCLPECEREKERWGYYCKSLWGQPACVLRGLCV